MAEANSPFVDLGDSKACSESITGLLRNSGMRVEASNSGARRKAQEDPRQWRLRAWYTIRTKSVGQKGLGLILSGQNGPKSAEGVVEKSGHMALGSPMSDMIRTSSGPRPAGTYLLLMKVFINVPQIGRKSTPSLRTPLNAY